MDKRIPKKNVDELAVVQAAAWAWYQHGSGYEGKATREFDLTRGHQNLKPSRYKLEAMKKNESDPCSSTWEPSSLVLLSPTHTDMSLLDSYEIGRIAKQFNSILDSSNICGDRSGYGGGSGYREKGSTMSENGTIKKKMAGKIDGFWLRHAIGICSTRGEVVEPIGVGRLRRRKRPS